MTRKSCMNLWKEASHRFSRCEGETREEKLSKKPLSVSTKDFDENLSVHYKPNLSKFREESSGFVSEETASLSNKTRKKYRRSIRHSLTDYAPRYSNFLDSSNTQKTEIGVEKARSTSSGTRLERWEKPLFDSDYSQWPENQKVVKNQRCSSPSETKHILKEWEFPNSEDWLKSIRILGEKHKCMVILIPVDTNFFLERVFIYYCDNKPEMRMAFSGFRKMVKDSKLYCRLYAEEYNGSHSQWLNAKLRAVFYHSSVPLSTNLEIEFSQFLRLLHRLSALVYRHKNWDDEKKINKLVSELRMLLSFDRFQSEADYLPRKPRKSRSAQTCQNKFPQGLSEPHVEQSFPFIYSDSQLTISSSQSNFSSSTPCYTRSSKSKLKLIIPNGKKKSASSVSERKTSGHSINQGQTRADNASQTRLEYYKDLHGGAYETLASDISKFETSSMQVSEPHSYVNLPRTSESNPNSAESSFPRTNFEMKNFEKYLYLLFRIYADMKGESEMSRLAYYIFLQDSGVEKKLFMHEMVKLFSIYTGDSEQYPFEIKSLVKERANGINFIAFKKIIRELSETIFENFEHPSNGQEYQEANWFYKKMTETYLLPLLSRLEAKNKYICNGGTPSQTFYTLGDATRKEIFNKLGNKTPCNKREEKTRKERRIWNQNFEIGNPSGVMKKPEETLPFSINPGKEENFRSLFPAFIPYRFFCKTPYVVNAAGAIVNRIDNSVVNGFYSGPYGCIIGPDSRPLINARIHPDSRQVYIAPLHILHQARYHMPLETTTASYPLGYERECDETLPGTLGAKGDVCLSGANEALIISQIFNGREEPVIGFPALQNAVTKKREKCDFPLKKRGTPLASHFEDIYQKVTPRFGRSESFVSLNFFSSLD